MNNYYDDSEGYWDGLVEREKKERERLQKRIVELQPEMYFWNVEDEANENGMTLRGISNFDELKFMYREELDGFQSWVKLRNGYIVSVVRHGASHGHDKRGLFEVGVFHADSETEMQMVTPDGWDEEVKGWLQPIHVLEEISKLDKQEIN
jgi:hypothetical protein